MRKYSPKIAKTIIELIRSDTYTITEVCKIVGISNTAFYKWLKKDPQFKIEVEEAKEELREILVVEAKRSLLKKIQGCTIEEKRIIAIPSKETDENGHPIPKIKAQITIKKHIQPDTAAIIFTLTNKEPNNWANRFSTTVIGKDMTPARILTKVEEAEYLKEMTDEDLENQISEIKNKIDGL